MSTSSYLIFIAGIVEGIVLTSLAVEVGRLISKLFPDKTVNHLEKCFDIELEEEGR